MYVGNHAGRHAAGLGTGPLLIDSQAFGEISTLAKEERWDDIAKNMQKSIDRFVSNGVEAVALSDLSLHRILPMLDLSGLSLIHIGEAMTKRAKSFGVQKIGFLGSQDVLQNDPITSYLQESDIEVVRPYPRDQGYIDQEIFGESYASNFVERQRILFETLKEMYNGEQITGVILGNTYLSEIFTDELRNHFCRGYNDIEYSGVIVPRKFSSHTFFDVYNVHIDAIAEYCLYGE